MKTVGASSVETAAAWSRVRPDRQLHGMTRPVGRSESHRPLETLSLRCRDVVRAPTCAPKTQLTRNAMQNQEVRRKDFLWAFHQAVRNLSLETPGPPIAVHPAPGRRHARSSHLGQNVASHQETDAVARRCVSRDEKDGRINEQLAQLSQNTPKHACAERLDQILLGHCPPLPALPHHEPVYSRRTWRTGGSPGSVSALFSFLEDLGLVPS